MIGSAPSAQCPPTSRDGEREWAEEGAPPELHCQNRESQASREGAASDVHADGVRECEREMMDERGDAV